MIIQEKEQGRKEKTAHVVANREVVANRMKLMQKEED